MNLKEALRLSSPKTAKKSNNRPSHRRPAGITRGGLAGVLRRRTETGGTLLPCAAPPPPPPPPPKRYRRDESGYDGRRGGYGPPDRSLLKDISLLLAYLIVVEDQIAFLTLQYLLGMIDLDMRMTVRWEEGMVTVMKGLLAALWGVINGKIVLVLKQLSLKGFFFFSCCRYQEYKSEYITTQKRVYFNAHKEEEWLKDKYHLTNLLTVIEKRNEHARKVAKDFLVDLQSGNLDLSCSDSIE